MRFYSLDTILELTEYHYIVRQMRTIEMSSIVKVVLSLLVCILVNVPKSDLSKCTHTHTHIYMYNIMYNVLLNKILTGIVYYYNYS